MGGIVRGVSHPRGLDAGRVPHRVAVGFTALADRLRTAYRTVIGHDVLPGGALGVCAGTAAGLLLWQSFWHGLVNPGVAVAVASAVGAVLLALPLRAVAGTFASTLSLAVCALAVLYFVTSPAGVQAGNEVAPREPLGQEVVELTGAPTRPESAPVESAASAEKTFGHAVYDAPVASRAGWEPVSPCHSRVRTWPGHGDELNPVAKGPCELLPPPPE